MWQICDSPAALVFSCFLIQYHIVQVCRNLFTDALFALTDCGSRSMPDVCNYGIGTAEVSTQDAHEVLVVEVIGFDKQTTSPVKCPQECLFYLSSLL
ncbi:MAG: hypothetical protein J6U65_02590 [Bacteroidaceae bacterium]|nr:hypothetical protein [Bacteroidaceae bacterium]